MKVSLSNPEKITITNATHVQEVEPLFWKLEDALYAGNLPTAKIFFEMFLYIGKHRKDLLAQGLKSSQRRRLQEIAYEISGESIVRTCKPVELKMAIASRKLPFGNERELNQYLCAHVGLLSDSLNEEVSLVGSEVETDFEYKCDIVVRGDTHLFPIELKIGQADHRVVSQIQKYCFYFYRSLRYNLHREVQGVVIGNGFDTWSINELRKLGILLFDIVPDGENITLRAI